MSQEFQNDIKQWVELDNEIRKANDAVKYLRSQRSELNDKINSYVNDNDIKHATININDGRIKFQNVKVTQPLTLKYIKECLSDCISNENDVDAIMNHIKEKREVKYTEEIKRYFNKE
jgi:seryl-tRNA synthetase